MVKVGIIGAGSIGKIHVKSFKAVPDAEIAALVDIDRAEAEKVAKENDIPKVYTDYKEMLKDETIDAVSICTPNYLHAPMTIDALEAGKHVLCEKPMTVNGELAQKMVDTAKRTGKTLMVALCWRFSQEMQTLKQIVEDGTLGEIYYAKAGILRTEGIPGMGGWFTTKEKSGGGPLMDLAPHFLDLAAWFMGFPKPVSVKGFSYAKIGPKGKGKGGWATPVEGGTFDVEDLAGGLIRFENGASLLIEMSWATYIREDVSYIDLIGDKGGAHLWPFTVTTEVHGKRVDITPKVRGGDTYKAEAEHFVECIKTGKKPLPTGEDGLYSVKIIEAIYRSAKEGREVEIR